MTVLGHRGLTPRVHPSCFVDDSVQLIGDVEVGEQSSLWFNTVVRGDVHHIRIGKRTNIQDLCVVHVSAGTHATWVGDDVTVGHRVVLHGCEVADRVLVGMGSILLDGVVIEPDCLIGAGSLVSPGTRIPAGSLALGSPARVKRPLSETERAFLKESAAHYVGYAAQYLSERSR